MGNPAVGSDGVPALTAFVRLYATKLVLTCHGIVNLSSPAAATDGVRRRSAAPPASLRRQRLPCGVLALSPLRSRAPLLQPGMPCNRPPPSGGAGRRSTTGRTLLWNHSGPSLGTRRQLNNALRVQVYPHPLTTTSAVRVHFESRSPRRTVVSIDIERTAAGSTRLWTVADCDSLASFRHLVRILPRWYGPSFGLWKRIFLTSARRTSCGASLG
jgi:hypothetical protein